MFSPSSSRFDFEQKFNRSLNLAKLFFQNKDYQSAKTYINDLLATKPDSSEAYKILSQINEALGENELAIKNYQKSLELKSVENNSFFNDYNFSPSKMKTINNKVNNQNKLNGPDQNQISSYKNDSDSDTLKFIEKLIDSKFTVLMNTFELIKDHSENLTKFSSKNSEEIISLKQELMRIDQKISKISEKQEILEKTMISKPKEPNLKKELEKISNTIEKFSFDVNQKFMELDAKIEIMNNRYDGDDDDEADGNTEEYYDDQNYIEEVENNPNYGYNDPNMGGQQLPQLKDLFPKQKENTWLCKVCDIANDNNDTVCSCCETPRNPTATPAPGNVVQTQITQSLFTSPPNQANTKFTFGNFSFPKFDQSAPQETTTLIQPPPQPQQQQQQQQPPPPPVQKESLFQSKPIFGNKANTLENNPMAPINFSTNTNNSSNSNSSNIFSNLSNPTTAPSSSSLFSFQPEKKLEPVAPPSLGNFSFDSFNKFPQPFSFGGNNNNVTDSSKSLSGFQFGNLNAISNQVPPPPLPSFNNSNKQTSQQQPPPSIFSIDNKTKQQQQNEPILDLTNFKFNVAPPPPSSTIKGTTDEGNENDVVENDDHNTSTELILPKVNLPENYEHITGEEDEQELFYIQRARLHVLVSGEYKERGTGSFKILQNKNTKKLRLVMRRDQVHKVCLNTPLTDSIKFENKDNKYLLFQCIDFSDGKPTPQTCLLKLKDEDKVNFLKFMDDFFQNKLDGTTTQIKQTIDSKQNLKSDSNKSETKGKLAQNNKIEEKDIELVYEKPIDPKYKNIIEQLKLPPNFFDYESKNTECKGCIGCKVDELNWNDLTYSALEKENQVESSDNLGFFSNLSGEVTTEKIDNVQLNNDSNSTVEPTNFVSEKSKMLPQNYVHTTGEEQEECVYKERAKLYRFITETSEFKERGVGDIKILKNKDKNEYRLLMRREIILKLICNHRLQPNLTFKDNDKNPNILTWATRDYSEDPNGEDQIFTIKFKDEKRKKDFIENIQKCLKNI